METQPKRDWRETILVILGTFFVLIVGGITGFMSWGHITEVGLSVAEPAAVFLPVCVDGMMLAGTVLGALDRLRVMRTRVWAIIGLWLGSLLTLGFNTLSAYERGPAAMAVAMLPAVTFLTSVEMIFHPGRVPLEPVKRGRKKEATDTQDGLTEAKPMQVIPVKKNDAETRTDRHPGRPGRKHGPQDPPQGRRIQNRQLGVGGRPKPSNGQRPDRPQRPDAEQRQTEAGNATQKPAEAAVAKAVADIPEALEGSLRDLVASAGTPAPAAQETVVS